MRRTFQRCVLKILGVGLLLGLGSSSLYAAQMSLAQYQALAKQENVRCIKGIKPNECNEELKYALDLNLIDNATYNWGKSAGYYPVFIRRGKEIGGICRCGCFAAGTQIATLMGDLPVEALRVGDQVYALGSQATLSNPHLETKPVQSTTEGAEFDNLISFKLSNGVKLDVTQHHGMLLASGKMVAAKDVVKGDQFLTADGLVVDVVARGEIKADGNVYNFEAAGQSNVEHIVVANNILVGDLAWQNQLQKDINAIALRK